MSLHCITICLSQVYGCSDCYIKTKISHCGGYLRNNSVGVGKGRAFYTLRNCKNQNMKRTRRIRQKHPVGNCWQRWELPCSIASRRRWPFLPSWVYPYTSLLGGSLLARKSRTRWTLGGILNCRTRSRSRLGSGQTGHLGRRRSIQFRGVRLRTSLLPWGTF